MMIPLPRLSGREIFPKRFCRRRTSCVPILSYWELTAGDGWKKFCWGVLQKRFCIIPPVRCSSSLRNKRNNEKINSMNMKKLQDKTVLITGGLSGIGKACAVAAAKEG